MTGEGMKLVIQAALENGGRHWDGNGTRFAYLLLVRGVKRP